MATDIPVVGLPGKVGTGQIMGASPLDASEGAVAAASTMEFFNDGNTFLIVDNQQAGAPVTVSYVMPTLEGLTITVPSQLMAQATMYMFGPFPPDLYNDSSGKVQITLSATTTIFAAATSLGT